MLTCLRCAKEWTPRDPDNLPRYCPQCHSAQWSIPPTRKNSRKPGDKPNPKWNIKPYKKTKGIVAMEKTLESIGLPPPPLLTPIIVLTKTPEVIHHARADEEC